MQTLKVESNKSSVEYDMNYATLYRLILRHERACEGPNRVVGDIFPDVKEATITRDQMMALGNLPNFVILTIDIKETGPDKSRLDYYFVGSDSMRRGAIARINRIVKGTEPTC